MLTDLIDIQ